VTGFYIIALLKKEGRIRVARLLSLSGRVATPEFHLPHLLVRFPNSPVAMKEADLAQQGFRDLISISKFIILLHMLKAPSSAFVKTP
jgi:hypothetical protein